MTRLLIIGCGDIALRTIPLLTKHYRVLALVRNSAYIGKLRSLGVTPIVGDLDDRKSLSCIAGLSGTVLHLAPPQNEGTRDVRTQHLLAAFSSGTLPRRLVYVSTSGVYGDCGGAVVNETHPIHPQNVRAQRRADAEEQIRAWARRNGVNASILRVPGIYGADRLPLQRIQQGTPAIVASEDSYTNHIHADDLASILLATLRRGKPNRVYHTVDDDEMKMGDYFDTVADAYRLPKPPRVSRVEAQRVLSPMLLSFMNESRRLTNDRMKKELKVKLRYPTVADALHN
jgi:nucleoside-diphosphate-sugar epimerase